MGSVLHSFKYIVTALWLGLVFLSPAQAAVLDDLFDELGAATSETQAIIESEIIAAWEKSGSPAMDLLLKRGKDAMAASEPDVAVEHLSALVDHAPDFAEGYHLRASAYFLSGMIGPALDDLRQTLTMEPRHFHAMRGVGVILEALGRPEDALEAYRAALALHPASPTLQDAVTRLTLHFEGQAL